MTDLQRYGTWVVTTEGDVEGRTTTQLGTYTGNVHDVAFHLANKCHYALSFTLVDENVNTNLYPTAKKVPVRIYDHNGVQFLDSQVRDTFKNTHVRVEPCNFYKALTLVLDNYEEQKREEALAKLSDEDKKVLGLV